MKATIAVLIVCLVALTGWLFWIGDASQRRPTPIDRPGPIQSCDQLPALKWRKAETGTNVDDLLKISSTLGLNAKVELDKAKKVEGVEKLSADLSNALKENFSASSEVSQDFWEQDILMIQMACFLSAESKRADLSTKQKQDFLDQELQWTTFSQQFKQSKLRAAKTPQPETELRFKAELAGPITFSANENGSVRAIIAWDLIPLESANEKQVRILFGIATIRNDATISADDDVRVTSASCKKTKGCLGSKTWNNAENPVIIRAGDQKNKEKFRWFADIPKGVKRIRLYWRFYQVENDNGTSCAVDPSGPAPSDGIPTLKVVASSNQKVGDKCYYYEDVDVLDVKN